MTPQQKDKTEISALITRMEKAVKAVKHDKMLTPEGEVCLIDLYSLLNSAFEMIEDRIDV